MAEEAAGRHSSLQAAVAAGSLQAAVAVGSLQAAVGRHIRPGVGRVGCTPDPAEADSGCTRKRAKRAVSGREPGPATATNSRSARHPYLG